ncbi:MAG: group II intron reverse transcriptase/maturase [Gammaproteobacteria bacterium]|nr:group II intron reverse transcriptase/maturase [Gammaproteobacteria bacterium]
MRQEEVSPSVLATTKQGTDIPAWMETSVWSERMLAALVNGVKGGKWFSLIDKVYAKATLDAAWQQVKANRGAAGIDRVSIERFSDCADPYLQELQDALKQQAYRPDAVKRVYIPKGGGQYRPLGIPTVKDRIVQAAVKQVIEPIFEHEFLNMSYGFRPQRGCKDALREVDEWLKAGYTYVVDADLQSYFDSIPHELLMQLLEQRISDKRLLGLIEQYLHQEVMEGMERWTPTGGTPQGAVLSPLLANIYLHPMDLHIAESGLKMVRYADDFVILCKNQADAERALGLVRKWVETHGLTLHPDKTHIGDCREQGQGFEFLGYRFEAGKRRVRSKSRKAIRCKIREMTKRSRSGSMQSIIAELNPVLRGWFNYFKHAHRYEFKAIDGFLRRRLRAMLLSRNKRKGCGISLYPQKRWRNIYFTEMGLFTMHEARLSLCQSR